ncbi:hypothetical protein INP51_06250 [Blautia liquoris]|jgi:hypothetical protein|uniref:Uncharacterized protein n=1 Tax=Blautia liquoris TaxID=2779518 RepID=A0A7M2RKG2_9FIRM|nr:hypothetical protein [Blautia liquoris]QOV20541.1 hypothetical protein INP51_06250 [Blautia liquoris]
MSNDRKLTQAEADKMLNMLKKTLLEEIEFPSKGKSIEFDVIGDTKKDIFTAKIYRGKINHLKYDFGARIKKDGILLLELHINPSSAHLNPDGKKIIGSHWHIYSEKYGRKLAFLAEDITSENFVENTLKFFKKFNIIEGPKVYCQEEFL